MDRRDCFACSNGRSGWQRHFGRADIGLIGIAMMVLLSGCSLLKAPQQVVTAVIPAKGSKMTDPLDLQMQVERFADDFSAQTAAAVDEYVKSVGTESARVEGLKRKLELFSAAVSIASGPQPKANLLDMVALTTLTRITAETRMANSTNAVASAPLLNTCRVLETNIWNLAAATLEPPQVAELRSAIYTWHAQNPDAHLTFFARPQQFASLIRATPQKGSDINSVFSLISLDPTAGLDPAVREVTLTRLFAERAMYTAQRMPFLLRLQIELLTAEVTRQPNVQLLLTNATRIGESMERLSTAAESVSRTTAELPDRISTERKEILAALDQQEGKLRDLAAEVNRSLASADKLSSSLTVTITNFDALMKRFGVGEPSTNSPPDTNSPPFKILDYAKTADQISGMAKELNTLIGTVDQSMPKVGQLGQQATADAERLVNRAFWLGLVLILILLTGGVSAALAYRILAGKLANRPSQASRVEPR
jgi:hypothetical protein